VAVFLVLLLGLLKPVLCLAGGGPVVVAPIQGMISPVTASYFHRVLAKAEQEKAQALVLELDTPGGMMEPMREMIEAMLAAPFPVVAYVYPQGARAASAGTFLCMASDLAVMAPNTNLGAAHPVDSHGGTVGDKITNDAAAYIKSLAGRKGRNAVWAEDAVLHSVSLSETEAIQQKVVELEAADEKELWSKLDARVLRKNGKDFVLAMSGADIQHETEGNREKFLGFLADPTLAYVLFLVGLYGLIFEVTHTGLVAPGIAGAICLVLAFVGFGSLPVNWGALALLFFGILLFAAEPFVLSHGAVALGGAVAMLFGSVLLYRATPSGIGLPWWVILVAVGGTALFFLVLVARAVKGLRRPKPKGALGLVGAQGEAMSVLDPEGMVHVGSEDWSAVSESGRIQARTKVEVVGVQGLKLVVKRA
jgi:membrane-bound serine protease (ClpP class)